MGAIRPFLLLFIPSFICILYLSLFLQYLSNKPSFTLLLLIFRFHFCSFSCIPFFAIFHFPAANIPFRFCSFYCIPFFAIAFNPTFAKLFCMLMLYIFSCCSVNITYSIEIHVTRSLTLLRLQCSNLHQL